MKRNAFTLIELLAVIVILAIIALIATPIVVNIINDAKKSSHEESIKMYAKVLEKAATSYYMKYTSEKSVTLEDLEREKLINYSGNKVECDIVKIYSNGKVYLKDCKVKGERVDYTYGEKQRDPNITVDLEEGLIPVIYDEDNWIVVDKNDLQWYDYDEQKWANAVVLSQEAKTNNKNKVGSILTVDGENPDILMMFVYIPRYEYKIEGQYGIHADGIEGTQQLPGEIEVNFIKNDKMTPTNGYILHPAFTFDDQQINGFWMGKFELSHIELSSSSTSNNLGCTNANNGVTCAADSSKFRILPNVVSLRRNNVSKFWYGIKSIENASSFGLMNIDIHMIKNSEWGAIAYLSQSKYGKSGNSDYDRIQKEIYQNKSSNHITGNSNGTPSQDISYTQCAYNQKMGTNTNQDKKNCGPGASTTGNIYGVYDMNGGSWEYVMGVYSDIDGIYSGNNSNSNSGLGYSGFNGKLSSSNEIINYGLDIPTMKYYDKYTTNIMTTTCDSKICYGHALSETSGWYNDYSEMITRDWPWFTRSGHYGFNERSGIFAFAQSTGKESSEITTRVVGIVK